MHLCFADVLQGDSNLSQRVLVRSKFSSVGDGDKK